MNKPRRHFGWGLAPNESLKLTGAAISVSHDIKGFQASAAA